MAEVVKEHHRLAPGLVCSIFRGNAGDINEFYTPELIRRVDVAWRQVVVSGEVEMTRVPQGAPQWPIQRVGFDDRDLPDLFPGDYARRCNEDGTVWISGCAIDSDPFESEIINLPQGSRFMLPRGHFLLLGAGTVTANGREVTGPRPIKATSGNTTFTIVRGPAIGVHFWR